MSNAAKAAALLCAALSLIACGPNSKTDAVTLDLGDVEDYAAFIEARGDAEKPEPFKPEPLLVSAVGKIQAQPDIAVITATITAEDKNESRAVNEMGEIINAVQTALAGRKIETGFTAINSSRKFDERCRNDNRFSTRRHNEIRNDFYFNQRLDNRGDTKTKRRDSKPRVAQQVCYAQSLKVSTDMVIRIQPANAAGDVLQALSEAGAKNSRLFGYDFTDYDALYQEAAAKAVKLAREKAQSVARIAGGTLGEIETFSVSGPDRTARFGPQPTIIRPANRYRGPSGSAVDRQWQQGGGNKNQRYARPAPAPAGSFTCWDGSVVYGAGGCAAQPARAFRAEAFDGEANKSKGVGRLASFSNDSPPLQAVGNRDAAIGFSGGQSSGNGNGNGNTNGNTNALSISLLSGPQTVSVTANLGYTYETPLNGKIIVEPKGK